MLSSNRVWVLTLASVVALGFAAIAMAQDSRPSGDNPGARGDRGNRPDFRNMTQEERDKWMADRRKERSKQMQEEMGATDDEWKVLEPKIQKLQELQRANMGSAFGGGRGGFGGRGGRGPGGPGGDRPAGDAPAGDQPKQSDIQKAAAELRKLVESKDAKPEDLKKALTALRDARAKAKAELDKARKELQEILTVKQEAVLVSRGILE